MHGDAAVITINTTTYPGHNKTPFSMQVRLVYKINDCIFVHFVFRHFKINKIDDLVEFPFFPVDRAEKTG